MMTEDFNLPVVLILFRRPAATAAVFAAIRRMRPQQLFLIADGPRPERPGEAAACQAARAAVANVDWPCELVQLYASHNLGLRQRVESGLDAVFAAVDQAIILEDDCLPAASFFPYCAELLARYRHDERVMAISGNSFQRRPPTRASYYFSRYPHCWGWATWARAWRHYDRTMNDWPRLREQTWLASYLGDRRAARAWRNTFDQVYSGQLESWAHRWTYSCWRRDALSALPALNLVSNIGFDAASTHTATPYSPFANLPLGQLRFPLRHPPALRRQQRADARTERRLFHPDLRMRLHWRLRRWLGLRRPLPEEQRQCTW